VQKRIAILTGPCEGQFDLAVVVVRPDLIHAFRAAVGDAPSSLFTLPPAGFDPGPLAAVLARLDRRKHNGNAEH
jgi:hypothetical protein